MIAYFEPGTCISDHMPGLDTLQDLLERGAGARTRDEFQARGAGRAGPGCPPSVRASVTLKKGPKGLQNHQETITFIDKSEKVKGFQVLK